MKILSITLIMLLAATALEAAPKHVRGKLSREEAVSMAQRNYGGKVLDIRRQDNGRYQIKMLKNGRIRVIHIDQESGRTRD
jgi:uncharacterized membrane protein YkoI